MSYVSEMRKLVGNRPLQLPGSCIIVYRRDSKTDIRVMLQLRSDHHKLGLLGGGIECGESYPCCAVRELFEEAALECRPEELKLINVYAGGNEYTTVHPNGDIVHHTIVLYSVPYEKTVKKNSVLDSETVRLEWLNLEEIKELLLAGAEENFFHCHIPIFRDMVSNKFFE